MPAKKKTKAKTKRLWGYLDGRGNEVIAPGFEEAEAFFGGGAWVKVDGRWGRIDPGGAWLVEPTFVELRERWHDLRKVVTTEDRVVWVDERSGQTRCDGLKVGKPNDWVEDPKHRYWANHGGTTDPHTHFCEGGAWQLQGPDHQAIGPALPAGRQPWWLGEDRFIASDAQSNWRVYALDGRPLGPERTGACYGIEGTRMRTYAKGFVGAYDLDGEVVIECDRFRSLTTFDERGLALAWLGDERVAVVDVDGRIQAEAELPFDTAAHCDGFVNGYARVNPGPGRSRHNLLGADGRWVLDEWAYDLRAPEADGWFAVRQTDSWNVRHVETGARWFEVEQRRVEWIPGWGWVGYATEGGRVGVRGSTAWLIEPFACDAISAVDDELVRVLIGALPGKHGLRRRDGSWAVEPVWDQIRVFDDVLLVALGGSLGYPWGRSDGRVRRKDASWTLLGRDGSEITTLGKLPWEPCPLAEDRMAFTPGKRRKSRK